MRHEIFVFGDWQALGDIQSMGVLRVEQSHRKEIFAFEYSRPWIELGNAMTLDPQLQLYPGPQYLSDNEHPNFGLFLDSSPDRWGQLLMKRREARLARKENRTPRTLLGTDFLLGVHDEQRIGGLRFKAAGLSLNMSDKDNSLNLELALEVAGYFRIDKPKANSILEEVTNAVVAWRSVATELGISRREQEFMAPAFRVVS